MMSYAPSLKVKAAAELEWRHRQHARGPLPQAWYPQDGPQRAAYESDADVIGYGGAAGGGKTDLLLGFAGTLHRRSIIFRRVFPSLRGMIERSREVFNARGDSHSRDSYNESLHVWRLIDGRMIEFGAVQYEADRKKHQGQPRDFMGFDEVTEFPELVVRFLMGWNRTTTPGQRCRVVMTFNPPMDDSGEWIVQFYAPWLDPDYLDPAGDGELRYVAMIDDHECFYRQPEDAPEAVRSHLKTRTFFHANLKDNPILEATGYGATIEGLPEPLRSILKGQFGAARVTNPWQVIPAEWVRLAQARWKAQQQPSGAPAAVGVDVAHGGSDQTVITRLYGAYGLQEKHPGRTTPRGSHVAALLADDIANECPIGMDVIGYGSSAGDILSDLDDVEMIAVNFAVSAPDGARDKSGKLAFRNLRAYCYWLLREALDPESGEDLALPDDDELRADLCAPTWSLTAQGIQLESKDDIADRIHRSPDCGDSYTIAYYVLKHHGGSWLLFGGG